MCVCVEGGGSVSQSMKSIMTTVNSSLVFGVGGGGASLQNMRCMHYYEYDDYR